jgi:hypothetical protein
MVQKRDSGGPFAQCHLDDASALTESDFQRLGWASFGAEAAIGSGQNQQDIDRAHFRVRRRWPMISSRKAVSSGVR